MSGRLQYVVVRAGTKYGYTFRVMMPRCIVADGEIPSTLVHVRREVPELDLELFAVVPIDAVVHIMLPSNTVVYELAARFGTLESVNKPSQLMHVFMPVDSVANIVDVCRDDEGKFGRMLMPMDTFVHVHLSWNDLWYSMLPWNDRWGFFPTAKFKTLLPMSEDDIPAGVGS